MSIYSGIGRYAKAYGKLLGGKTSAEMLERTAVRGYRAVKSGSLEVINRRARANGAQLGKYFWSGATGAEKTARIGTVAGGAFLAGNFINPRDNFGPF